MAAVIFSFVVSWEALTAGTQLSYSRFWKCTYTSDGVALWQEIKPVSASLQTTLSCCARAPTAFTQ